ncbi:MAG: hypothetical protein RMY29_010895 [Nostoc sp. CreGUA01]|nr:hypothetical protein [Nostoc sp. CreGUA01]
MAIRYLLDEHLSPKYRSQLVRRNPELVVRIIGDLDVPPKGTLDPALRVAVRAASRREGIAGSRRSDFSPCLRVPASA